MKKIIYIITILCLIFIAMNMFLTNKVYAINQKDETKSLENFLQEMDAKMKQDQEEWRQKYYGKIQLLEILRLIINIMILFNIILFTIFIDKGKKRRINYIIMQILVLLLMLILEVLLDSIPSEPWVVGLTEKNVMKDTIVMKDTMILVDFLILQIIVLSLTVFINKNKYLLLISILPAIIAVNFTLNRFEILPIMGLAMVTNLLFTPLYYANYVNKKELKEEENVRI